MTASSTSTQAHHPHEATLRSVDEERCKDYGASMYSWATDLFPVCRSLTGEGVRQTLQYLREILPDLEVQAVPTGTRAFDWTVPQEWNIRDAFIADERGNRVVDFRQNNLHVVGYSEPVDQKLPFHELDKHLFHLPDVPHAIPYITSYYNRRWGFCMSHDQYREMCRTPNATYHACIDASLEDGVLNYAELTLPGSSHEEVFFSTYICHPSMANNELSGPCLQAAIADWVSTHLPNRRLTYRFFFGPETLGPIVYLSRHLDKLKQRMVAGFVLSCMGDDRTYSYLASRTGSTLADRVARHVLHHVAGVFKSYSYLDRESDERQYCAPGVDLPVCTLTRSKFNAYPEYHTSLDDLRVISPNGFATSFQLITEMIRVLESNATPTCLTLCEPQLGSRGLYPTLSTRKTREQVRTMMNVIAYSDGTLDLVEIAELLGEYVGSLLPIVRKLIDANVLSLQHSGGELESERC